MRRKLLITAAFMSALILFGVLAGCALGVSQRNKRAFEQTPPEGKFLNIDGAKLHYILRGQISDPKPVLVLIHGAGSNLREWTFSLVDKVSNDFTVVAFDRPGHGYSETLHSKGESLSEQAALFDKVLAKLGIERAIVAGHSYGGAVALAWTLNHPQRVAGTLAISGVSNPWPGGIDALYKLNGGTFTGPLVSNSIAAIVPQQRIISGFNSVFLPQSAPAGYAEYMGVDLAVRASQLRANGRQVNTMRPHIVKMSKRYGEIRTPVEIIHGTADTTVPATIHADVLSKQIPHSNYQRIEGMGHGAQQLAHPEILDALKRLKSIWAL